MQCEYKKWDGSRCHREALHNSEKGFCLLHEEWDYKCANDTLSEFYREIGEGISDFEGCILPEIDLSGRRLKGDLNFKKTKIGGNVNFANAEIDGEINFANAEIEGRFRFRKVIINGGVIFINTTIGLNVSFERARINGYIFLKEATIGKSMIRASYAVSFKKAIISEVMFSGAIIEGSVLFEKATIKRYLDFSNANIYDLSFKDAKFHKIKAQEIACREAKITNERRGNRALADYHFYREMVAKRKQKYKMFSLNPFLKLIRKLRLKKLEDKHKEFLEKERRIDWGFLELPIQYIFGYGVHPWRVITTWLVTVFVLAFVYWLGHGVEAADSFWECLYFSVVTAATPGYGGYHPNPGCYQGLASFEAIFGTFMWAAFIATFARKYMR